MRKYLRFIVVAFSAQMTYRGSMLIRGLRDISSVMFFVVLWAALFKEKTVIGGFTFYAMVTYYVLAKIIDQMYSYEPSRLMTRDIITGDLSNYLIKPMRYFTYMIFLSVGRRFARSSTSLVIIILAFIFLSQWVVLPPNASSLIFFCFSAVLSWILLFEFAFLIGTLSFWSSETSGLQTAFDQLVLVLGGSWIPLNLFPEGVSRIVSILPFKYLYYDLVLIYQGKISSSEFFSHLAAQTAWVVALFLCCYVFWRKGTKNYASFGK